MKLKAKAQQSFRI